MTPKQLYNDYWNMIDTLGSVLNQWIITKKYKRSWVASELGITPSYLYTITHTKRLPGELLVARILILMEQH